VRIHLWHIVRTNIALQVSVFFNHKRGKECLTYFYTFLKKIKRQIPGCVLLLVEAILRPANERLAEQQLIWLGGD
jgi:hypothetical protein